MKIRAIALLVIITILQFQPVYYASGESTEAQIRREHGAFDRAVPKEKGTAVGSVLQRATEDSGRVMGKSAEEAGFPTNTLQEVMNSDGTGDEDIEWESSLGDDGDQCFRDIIKLNTGYYVAVGYTNSQYNFGGYDMHAAIYTQEGTLIDYWLYGSEYNEYAESAVATSDGGFILVGYTTADNGSNDIKVIKCASDFNIEWSAVYGDDYNDIGKSIIETADGGYAIGATYGYDSSDSDLWLIKTDSGGETEWNSLFGGYGKDTCGDIIQTADGYVMTGAYTFPDEEYSDLYLAKSDFQGELITSRLFGQDYADAGSEVTETEDGFAVCGHISFSETDSDMLLVFFDSGLNSQDYQLFGGDGADYGCTLVKTLCGGFVLAGGYCWAGQQDYDPYIVKTDKYGIEEWHTFSYGDYFDCTYGILQTEDGGYIAVGETKSYTSGSNADGHIFKVSTSIYLPELELQGFDVSDYSTAPVETLVGGRKITATANVYNNTSIVKSAKLIAVLYNSGNKIEQISFSIGTIQPKSTGSIVLTNDINLPSIIQGHRLKLMVWSSPGLLKPVKGKPLIVW